MAQESSSDRRILIEKVQHPSVEQNQRFSIYNLLNERPTNDWQLFEKLPPRYKTLFEQAMMAFHPRPFYQGEGFIANSHNGIDTLLVTMNSAGSPPVHIPTFGSPRLKLADAIHPIVKPHTFSHRSQFEQQFPFLNKTSIEHRYLAIEAWVDTSRKALEIAGEIKDN